MQPVDHGGRRPRGCKDAKPVDREKGRQSLFPGRRHLGQEVDPRLARHRQRLQPAVPDEGDQCRQIHGNSIYMARERIRDGRARPLVGHMGDAPLRGLLEQFNGQVRQPAVARRRDRHLLLLRQFQQLAKALHRQAGADRDGFRGQTHGADGREVVVDVEGHLRQEMRRNHQRAGAGEHQRVAIGGGFGDLAGGHGAAGARLVFHQHLLAQQAAQPGRDDARDDVVRAARRKTHDQLDGLAGVDRLGLGWRPAHARRQAGQRQSSRQQRPAQSGVRSDLVHACLLIFYFRMGQSCARLATVGTARPGAQTAAANAVFVFSSHARAAPGQAWHSRHCTSAGARGQRRLQRCGRQSAFPRASRGDSAHRAWRLCRRGLAGRNKACVPAPARRGPALRALRGNAGRQAQACWGPGRWRACHGPVRVQTPAACACWSAW